MWYDWSSVLQSLIQPLQLQPSGHLLKDIHHFKKACFLCKQQLLTPICASMQSHQHLCCSLFEKYVLTVSMSELSLHNNVIQTKIMCIWHNCTNPFIPRVYFMPYSQTVQTQIVTSLFNVRSGHSLFACRMF